MVQRLLHTFYFEHKKIDELNYKRLSLETFDGTTWDEAKTHFTRLINEYKVAGRNHLIDRIRKGEAYLESIDESHQNYRPAEEKLVKLINELATFNM